jgi:hypothetical protein
MGALVMAGLDPAIQTPKRSRLGMTAIVANNEIRYESPLERGVKAQP